MAPGAAARIWSSVLPEVDSSVTEAIKSRPLSLASAWNMCGWEPSDAAGVSVSVGGLRKDAANPQAG